MPDERPGEPRSTSLLGAVNALLRQRWTVIGTALLVATAVAVVTLVLPRTYTSTTSFVPQTPSQQLSGLSTVAAQFGLAGADAGNTESPAFYVDLVTSREVLSALAESTYTVPAAGEPARPMRLGDILEIEARDPDLRQYRVAEYLRKHVNASATPKTGAIVISVTTRSAPLSTQLTQRLLAQVTNFNETRRQSRAMAERRFTERQMTEARDALAAAERRLEAFLTRNRQFTGSPSLEFERDRLSREVNVRTQRFMSVSDAYERARIEEIRDTPVITVIERPVMPVLPNRRHVALKTLVGLVVGAIFGIVIALARHFLAATQRSRSDEYAEFVALRRETVADLKRPWRPLLRQRSSA